MHSRCEIAVSGISDDPFHLFHLYVTSVSNKHVLVKKGVFWGARGEITTTRRLVRHADRHTGRLYLHHSFYNWKHMRSFSAQMWRFLTRPHKKVNFSRVDLHVRPLLVVESSSFIKRLGLRKWGVEKKKKKYQTVCVTVCQQISNAWDRMQQMDADSTAYQNKAPPPRNWSWIKMLNKPQCCCPGQMIPTWKSLTPQ